MYEKFFVTKRNEKNEKTKKEIKFPIYQTIQRTTPNETNNLIYPYTYV